MTTNTLNSGSSTSSSVRVGATVMTADGKKLGVVKAALSDRFLVDVRWAADYWLGTETIDSTDANLVNLMVTKAGIGAAKLRNEVTGPGLGRDAEDFNGPAPADRPQQSL